MYNDLISKDKQLYTQNGILHMLDRNRRIKPTPERFQECKEEFDVIFSVEERVFDQVIEDLENREKNSNQLVHIINIDVADNHEDATLGAFMLLEFAQKLQNTEDLDNEIDELIQEFEAKIQRTVLHTIAFY
jgi:RNA polymerase II subunit A C-terminal domain phosphatase SSU72